MSINPQHNYKQKLFYKTIFQFQSFPEFPETDNRINSCIPEPSLCQHSTTYHKHQHSYE